MKDDGGKEYDLIHQFDLSLPWGLFSEQILTTLVPSC